MKKHSIVLRAYSGKPLATVEGYAFEVEEVTLVVHPAHMFIPANPDGSGLRITKPKGAWQVSDPETGMTVMGPGPLTCASRAEAVERATRCLSTPGAAAHLRNNQAKALERYAVSLV